MKLTRTEQRKYKDLQRKTIKGVEVFKCEPDNCWLTERACLLRQEQEIKLKNNFFGWDFEPNCLNCEAGIILSKKYNKKIRRKKAIKEREPENFRECKKCGKVKSKEHYQLNKLGFPQNWVCYDCKYAAQQIKNMEKTGTAKKRTTLVAERDELTLDFMKNNKEYSQRETADKLGFTDNQVYLALRRKKEKESKNVL